LATSVGAFLRSCKPSGLLKQADDLIAELTARHAAYVDTGCNRTDLNESWSGCTWHAVLMSEPQLGKLRVACCGYSTSGAIIKVQAAHGML
jgi:hypothetical protein